CMCPMPLSRRTRGWVPTRASSAVLVSLLLGIAGLAGCSSDDGPERTVDTFLDGWRAGKLDQVGFLNPAGQRISAAEVAEEIETLSGDLADTAPTLRRQGKAKITGDIATAQITVT